MRIRRRHPKVPVLSALMVCIEVPADSALAARALVAESVLPNAANIAADHPAAAFFVAWDKEIAQARIDFAEAQEGYAERLAEEKAKEGAEGARDFLLAVMKGERTATENQIAAAEALTRAL